MSRSRINEKKMQRRTAYRMLAGRDYDPELGVPIDTLAWNLRNSTEEFAGLSLPQRKELLRACDDNKDGYISRTEFEHVVTGPRTQPTFTKRAMYYLAEQVVTPEQAVEVRSYIDEYHCCPPPMFIVLITLAQIGAFVYYYLNEKHPHDIMTHCAGCYVNGKVGPLMFAPPLREQAWRFVSYQFLHGGLSHLLGNVIFQLILGIPLELVHHFYRIGPLYCMAVVSGALLQYSMDPKVFLVGASAGVYALIFAHLANVILNWSEMPLRWMRLLILAVFCTFDIGGTVFRRLYMDECDTISHCAHIGGAITGLCFGVAILYNIVEHTWEKIVKWTSIALYVLFIIVTVYLVIRLTPTSKPIWDTAKCLSNM